MDREKYEFEVSLLIVHLIKVVRQVSGMSLLCLVLLCSLACWSLDWYSVCTQGVLLQCIFFTNARADRPRSIMMSPVVVN